MLPSAMVPLMHKTELAVPPHMKYRIRFNAQQIEPLPLLSNTVSVRRGRASLGNYSFPAQALVMYLFWLASEEFWQDQLMICDELPPSSEIETCFLHDLNKLA
jgi:hypothetical protein